MKRLATCLCGETTVTCQGDPLIHVQCSCRACQKMYGAPSAYLIYYASEQVSFEGNLKTFKRDAIIADGPTLHLCNNCGSTVFTDVGWTKEALGLDIRAIPYGVFENPDFDAPKIAVWNRYLPGWLESSAPADCTMEEQPETLAEFRETAVQFGIL